MKGIRGVVPCALCSNVVSRRSGLEDHDAELVAISKVNVAKFRARSDEDLWTAPTWCTGGEEPGAGLHVDV